MPLLFPNPPPTATLPLLNAIDLPRTASNDGRRFGGVFLLGALLLALVWFT